MVWPNVPTVLFTTILLILVIGVVLPGVWSGDPCRRDDAHEVLRLLLTRGSLSRHDTDRKRRPRYRGRHRR